MRLSALSTLFLLVSPSAFATGKMSAIEDSPLDCELQAARDNLEKRVDMPTHVIDSVTCTAERLMETDLAPVPPNKQFMSRQEYRAAKKAFDRQRRARKKSRRKATP